MNTTIGEISYRRTQDIIEDSKGETVCILPSDWNYSYATLIESAPEMLIAIREYVTSIEEGKSTMRKTYNKFKELLKKFE